MYKIISMDLDETLLTTDKVMTESFKPFVKKLRDNNYMPVVATGREYYSAKKFVGDVDIDLICNNGNIIRDNKTGKIEYINPIEPEDLKDVMSFDTNENVYSTIHVSREDEINLLYKKKNLKTFDKTYVYAFDGRNEGVDDFIDFNGIPLSIVFAGHFDELLEMKNKMEEKLSDRFNFHIMKIKREPKWMLEVLQKNGDKFFGVKEYAKSRNVDMKEVIAIGDDSNDKMLIEKSGLGIAMINAVQILKDVADLISDYDNNNDGAIKMLDKVIFG